jgi:hypothetical protein
MVDQFMCSDWQETEKERLFRTGSGAIFEFATESGGDKRMTLAVIMIQILVTMFDHGPALAG